MESSFRLVACMAVLFVLAACSDDATPPFTSPNATIVDGLSVLPLSNETTAIEITVTDYDAAAEAMGVEPLPDGADARIAADWVNQLFVDRLQLRPPSIVPNDLLSDPAAIEAEFGWSFYDVDDSAEIHVPSATDSSRFVVLRGDVEWADEVDGVGSIGDGEDGAVNASDRSDVRPLGVPVRTGSRDGLLAAATSTEQMERWVADEFVSADSDARLVSAGERLDAVDAYAALIIRDDFSRADGLDETLLDPLDEPFHVIGYGLSGEFAELTATMVYVFDDDAAAGRAEDQIDDRWRAFDTSELDDTFEIETLEQRGDAVVVIGRVDSGRFANLVFDRARADGLFRHT